MRAIVKITNSKMMRAKVYIACSETNEILEYLEEYIYNNPRKIFDMFSEEEDAWTCKGYLPVVVMIDEK